MIHSIKLRNFKGFKDEAVISFLVNNRPKSKNKYATTPTGERVSKVGVVVGPNGSGKTNLLRTLAILKWLLSASVKDQNNVSSLIEPFATAKDVPTLVEVVFNIDDDLFTYSVQVMGTKILSELLNVRRKNNLRQSTKIIFAREWDGKKKKYNFKKSKEDIKTSFERMNTTMLEDISMNAIAAIYGDDLAVKIASYWNKVVTNIDLSKHNFAIYGMEAQLIFYRLSQSKKKAEQFFESIHTYNQNLSRYNAKTNKVEVVTSDGEFGLDIDQLSSGTTQLVVIKDKLEKALSSGGIAVIDEFDAYLHPIWLADLISQFIDPNINKKNAQLLTSTHNPQVLNLLEQYQIYVTDINDGKQEVSRLDEIQGTRADDNFFANYMSGRYGGIPEIY
ncbi:MAG: hypothetical protein JWN33_530 [Candidatus Saccharibacteria bacterium]|nr:hypothetical protein [Candidatus Saccharibacteria bacterium]